MSAYRCLGVLCCVLVVTMVHRGNAVVVQLDLTGAWNVSNTARQIHIPGKVPGSMYTALLDSSMIPDPYYRDNDVKLAWIAHDNWTYTRYFNVSSTIYKSQSVLLVAEGVDTVSTVVINGQHVGSTDNMFIKYTWEVKSYLSVTTAARPHHKQFSISDQCAV
ncbi:beta-mannosidase-like [Littorina saxatilis]|uniref:beta-mannosidase-like n=1 Tax=Littorina saxatilis TaxID=31220 RepID=UPI0038B44C47